MTVKEVTALEYDGRLFRNVKEVKEAMAREALSNAYSDSSGVYDNRFRAILSDPEKAFSILKEIYSDS